MPRHEEHKIVKNTFIFTGALLLQKVLSFLYFFYLSSRMSPGVIGSYVWALSFTTLFSIGTDLGLAQVFTREAARSAERNNRLLRNVLGLKIPIILITVLIALVTIILSGRSKETIMLVAVALGVMSLDALSYTLYSSLRARQNIFYESIGIIVFQVVVFGSGVILWESSHKIVLVMAALLAGSLVNMFLGALILKLRFGYKLSPLWEKEIIRMFWKAAPAFALTGIFIRIFNAADTVFLGIISGNHAVGIYSIPAKVITALQALIPGAFAASIFPSMSNYYVTSRERLGAVFNRSFGYIFLLAAPVAVGLAALSKPILIWLWPEYVEAAPAFFLMGISAPFLFLLLCTGSLLNASNRERRLTLHRGASTGLNIALNIAFIPFLGPTGAALAFLITNIFSFFLDMAVIVKIIPWQKQMTAYVIKVMAASGLLSLTVMTARDALPLGAVILCGFIVYALSIFLLGVVTLKDIQTIKLMLKKAPPPSEMAKSEPLYEETITLDA